MLRIALKSVEEIFNIPALREDMMKAYQEVKRNFEDYEVEPGRAVYAFSLISDGSPDDIYETLIIFGEDVSHLDPYRDYAILISEMESVMMEITEKLEKILDPPDDAFISYDWQDGELVLVLVVERNSELTNRGGIGFMSLSKKNEVIVKIFIDVISEETARAGDVKESYVDRTYVISKDDPDWMDEVADRIYGYSFEDYDSIGRVAWFYGGEGQLPSGDWEVIRAAVFGISQKELDELLKKI